MRCKPHSLVHTFLCHHENKGHFCKYNYGTTNLFGYDPVSPAFHHLDKFVVLSFILADFSSVTIIVTVVPVKQEMSFKLYHYHIFYQTISLDAILPL